MTGAPCPNHPAAVASGACSICGRALCERCLLPFAGRSWCAACKAGPAFQEAIGSRGPSAPPAPMGLLPKILIGGTLASMLACFAGVGWVAWRAKRGIDDVRLRIAEFRLDKLHCEGELERIGDALRLEQKRTGTMPRPAPHETVANVLRRLDASGTLVRRMSDTTDGSAPLFHCEGGAIPAGNARTREENAFAGLGRGTLPYEGPEAPLLWCLATHEKGGRAVLFESGAVRFIEPGEKVTVIDRAGKRVKPDTPDEALEDHIAAARVEREITLRLATQKVDEDDDEAYDRIRREVERELGVPTRTATGSESATETETETETEGE